MSDEACDECGATVETANAAQHADWHRGFDERILRVVEQWNIDRHGEAALRELGAG